MNAGEQLIGHLLAAFGPEDCTEPTAWSAWKDTLACRA
jgi:hypothetical protein